MIIVQEVQKIHKFFQDSEDRTTKNSLYMSNIIITDVLLISKAIDSNRISNLYLIYMIT